MKKTTTKKVRSIKSPRQKRSMQTHNALLDAAEKLLKERPWEEISTVAIMVEAGLSNGAIYGRFKSKDNLLIALCDRHDKKLKERFNQQQKGAGKKDETMEEFLERELDQLVTNMYENRWLLRAMGLLARQKPEVVSQSTRGERRDMFEKIVAQILQFEDEIKHPYPERGAELAVFFVSTILREAILYQGPHFGTLDISEKELKEAVKRMALSFLRTKA
jgi:AcrR family transcriptional regulator